MSELNQGKLKAKNIVNKSSCAYYKPPQRAMDFVCYPEKYEITSKILKI